MEFMIKILMGMAYAVLVTDYVILSEARVICSASDILEALNAVLKINEGVIDTLAEHLEKELLTKGVKLCKHTCRYGDNYDIWSRKNGFSSFRMMERLVMAANITEVYIDELQNYMSGNYLSKVIKMKSILVKSKNAFRTANEQLRLSDCQQKGGHFNLNTPLKVSGHYGKDSDVRLLTVFKEIEFIHSIQKDFFLCKYHKVINQPSPLPNTCLLFGEQLQ